LSGSRRLLNAAATLRVARSRTSTKFFARRESALARAVAEIRTPPVARTWGFHMHMPMGSFETLFEKFRVMHIERAGAD
jgi:hypothetical protein